MRQLEEKDEKASWKRTCHSLYDTIRLCSQSLRFDTDSSYSAAFLMKLILIRVLQNEHQFFIYLMNLN